MRRSRNSQSW